MRRFVVFAFATSLATGSTLVFGMATASAHICPIPAQIEVARSATIQVGVTVEGAVVPDVEIGIPTGLRLDRVDPKAGWTVTRSGSTVRYHGGPILAFTCEYFSLGVTAPSPGSWGIRVVQRNAAGAIVADAVPDPGSPQDRALDQFVYAGVKPPSPPSTSSGQSGPIIAGIVLVGFGLVMFVALQIRSRRHDTDDTDGERDVADRDAELEARLDRFKKRRPGSPPPD